MGSGAITLPMLETLSIEEIASKDTRITEGFMEDLYLIWQDDIGKLKCFKGRYIISAKFLSLLVIPERVIDFRCSVQSNEVLITSVVVDDGKTLEPVFIRMADVAAVERLFDLISVHARRWFEPTLVER